MKTVIISDIPKTENPHGIEAKKIHENDHVQVVHMTLQPGEKLKKHTTPVDVFFYILEGTCTVEIGDEIQTVTKDTLVDSPARIPHGLQNNSNSILRLLVVKTPRPTSDQNKETIQILLNSKKS
jgi:mannose-6-phosphate isomerase-like protein (cupin superfamily)